MLDSVTWSAFALTFTILGGLGTWFAYRRRGLRAGLRWAAATLLVPAAYLTHTLKMLGRIGSAVADWGTSFVWNPLVWVGLGLAVLSVALFAVAARLPGRDRKQSKTVAPGRTAGRVDAGKDPELAEIEALLKRRGIN